MGTNYYALSETCTTCGQKLPEMSPMPEIHLGKSSMGWKFTLQLNGKKYYKNWQEMKGWLVGKKIQDEYGDLMTTDDFVKFVESKQKIKNPEDTGCIVIDGYDFLDCEFS
jgi:hypothetical protein